MVIAKERGGGSRDEKHVRGPIDTVCDPYSHTLDKHSRACPPLSILSMRFRELFARGVAHVLLEAIRGGGGARELVATLVALHARVPRGP